MRVASTIVYALRHILRKSARLSGETAASACDTAELTRLSDGTATMAGPPLARHESQTSAAPGQSTSADRAWCWPPLAQCCPGPSLLWLSCSSTGLQCPVSQTWSHSYLEQKNVLCVYWSASRHRGSYCQTLLEHRVKSVNIFSSLVSGSLNFKLKVDSTAVSIFVVILVELTNTHSILIQKQIQITTEWEASRLV